MGKWVVVQKAGLTGLDRQKEVVKSLLTNIGLDSVQTDLDLAERDYVNGNYSQSLIMSRKALEDATDIIAKSLKLDRKTLFSSLTQSDSATDILRKIYGYTCKGHSSQAAEYEAIFGYHLVISAINYLALFFVNINSSRDQAKTIENYFVERNEILSGQR